jgi:hypothetical protein
MLSLQLLEIIRHNTEESQEAALALGLLLEQEKVNLPSGNRAEISAIIGDELGNYALSPSEFTLVVDQLIDDLSQEAIPHPMAVWALTKSYEQRALPCLIQLLERVINDSNYEHLCYQSLIGILNIGVPINHQESVKIIKKAAQQGYGMVKKTAEEYLSIHPELLTDF